MIKKIKLLDQKRLVFMMTAVLIVGITIIPAVESEIIKPNYENLSAVDPIEIEIGDVSNTNTGGGGNKVIISCPDFPGVNGSMIFGYSDITESGIGQGEIDPVTMLATLGGEFTNNNTRVEVDWVISLWINGSLMNYSGVKSIPITEGYWNCSINLKTGKITELDFKMDIPNWQLTPPIPELGDQCIETGPWSLSRDTNTTLDASIDWDLNLKEGTMDLVSYGVILDLGKIYADEFPEGKFTDDNEGLGSFNFDFVSQDGIEVDISGIFGVHASIQNKGDVAVTNVDWYICVNGGLVFYGSLYEGTIASIAPGASLNAKSGLILGFGPAIIFVNAGGTSNAVKCFLLGPFVLGVK